MLNTLFLVFFKIYFDTNMFLPKTATFRYWHIVMSIQYVELLLPLAQSFDLNINIDIFRVFLTIAIFSNFI